MAKKAIFDKKNVIVTGGAGFVGSHLCEELLKTSKVICIDNFISGDEKNIDNLLQDPDFKFIKHDLIEDIDLESFSELEVFKVKFQGIQEIYHLACPTSAKNFEKTKIETLLSSCLATKHALDLAVKYKAKILFTSSSVVYGPRGEEQKNFTEDHIGNVDLLSPRACYDEGKRFAETMVSTYRDVYNIDAKIARIFRTYGPRLKLDDGQMIPDFVDNALDNQDIIIYGDENFTTSLCYVSDIITGLIKMMSSTVSDPVNLGSDIEYKLSDVAKKIIEMTGSKSKIKFEKPLLFMSPLGLPNISTAKTKLSWFPVVRLEDGISKTIDYLKAAKGLLDVTKK
ncbi:GDP-mannose 4,6-dehydratase [Patescibacteria group bacterium]|nr:GDP-mannose 4,6-dehydratase [Patescibacteria group bacterium]